MMKAIAWLVVAVYLAQPVCLVLLHAEDHHGIGIDEGMSRHCNECRHDGSVNLCAGDCRRPDHHHHPAPVSTHQCRVCSAYDASRSSARCSSIAAPVAESPTGRGYRQISDVIVIPRAKHLPDISRAPPSAIA